MIRLLARIAVDVDQIKNRAGGSGPLGGGDEEELGKGGKSSLKGIGKLLFGTVGAIIGVLAGIIPATKRFAEHLFETNREFAHYSGSLAASFQQADVARFMLNIQKAHGIERSALGVNREYIEFQKALMPLETMFANFTNVFAVAWLQGATAYAKAITETLQGWGVPEMIDAAMDFFHVQKHPKNDQKDLIRQLVDGLARGGKGVQRSKPMASP